jgi:hypothetical protein
MGRDHVLYVTFISLVFDSLMVSIPTFHVGERGWNPRRVELLIG